MIYYWDLILTPDATNIGTMLLKKWIIIIITISHIESVKLSSNSTSKKSYIGFPYIYIITPCILLVVL